MKKAVKNFYLTGWLIHRKIPKYNVFFRHQKYSNWVKKKQNSLSIVAVCRTKFSEKCEFILVFFLNTIFTYSGYLDNTINASNKL